MAVLRAGRIGVVKIDVEGAELEVLRGLLATIAAHRPHVLCEILPLYDESDRRWAFRKPRQEDLIALMRAAGYALFRLLASGNAVRLETIAPHGNPKLSNHAFVPCEAAEAFAHEFAN